MIKLVIFDLDGVLLDAKMMHFQSLNTALKKIGKQYVIEYDEHLTTYDGLPTKRKLEILTSEKNLPNNKEIYEQIYKDKQQATLAWIERSVTFSTRLASIFSILSERGVKIVVASNSIRNTVRYAITHLGIMKYVDFYYSNEDVHSPKPSPEMYLKAMVDSRVAPTETLILEDSPVGQEAVSKSGAFLCPIANPEDVTLDKIIGHIDRHNEKKIYPKAYSSYDVNILIPMSGAGSRFAAAGYTFPKPLIDVLGKPMIQTVVDNININGHYIFVVQEEQYIKYNLGQVLQLISPGCEVIKTSGMTEGAACTTLLAKSMIDNKKPLIIANSDQYVNWKPSDFMYKCNNKDMDGSIVTFNSVSPKWSFAKLDSKGLVIEVAEKKPISNIATTGIYWFKHGSDYVASAESMIKKNIRVNNEFYVCPVFNELIEAGKKIKTYHLEENSMWGLGTPEDLRYFLENHK